MNALQTTGKISLMILLLSLCSSGIFAQQPNAPRGNTTPKMGVAPLPILPALPEYKDTTFFATRNIPHGKVVQATYKNFSGAEKRMHVYLPPNYDTNAETRYPVLYLNHGGGDNDSWWTAHTTGGGKADLILDNLIAEGKAKSMIIVMPDTRGTVSFNLPPKGTDDICTQEYLKDIIPYVDKTFRTRPNRENRALAGLSMGGLVVLHTGLTHLDTFSELYIYSSGHSGTAGNQAFEERFSELFKDPKTNDLFRVPIYMAQGETDIALLNGQGDWAVINKYGIRNFWVLSTGGHEGVNWRRYLYQTAQIMFPADYPKK